MHVEKYDILVVGLGVMGCAVLYELAKHGIKVAGLERFSIAHDRGSSHGETRMVRKAYFEHPDYIPLLDRAYEKWQQLEEASGRHLMVQNGLLLAGPLHSRTITGLERCYSEHDLSHEQWSVTQARRQFPQFVLPENYQIFFDPLAGYLHAETCVQTLAELAVQKGATIYQHEPMISWQSDGQVVTIQTPNRRMQAGRGIITMGAWAKELLKNLVELQIWRKVLIWYRSRNMDAFQSPHFPNFYVELEYGGFYGFPAINSYGIKVGEHTRPEVIANPEMLDRQLKPEDEIPIRQFLQQVLPQLQPERTRYAVCMYCKSPDEHFILDVHPQYENIVLAAGFSGHGFKFAPVIGEILAELALEGTTRQPIDFLRLHRFR